ncbi:MAG: ABC transporter ATP-binding protein [Deltaproteobacteria bacterium]|nr:ABC transporter ATP-binding protein [Deltaproteobacteria bacterium]
MIELVKISKRFTLGSTFVDAVSDLTLSIAKGEFVAITGPSGSGKTTILNLIGCLDSPTSGVVRINGKRTSDLKDAQLDRLRATDIGFMFQSFNLVPVLTAAENVEVPLYLHKIKAEERKKRALEALELVGLGRFANFLPDQLSGGQRQRVSIARALITRPSLVLADEPTANLDSANAQGIVELMRKLNEEQAVTFVFSTHDQGLLGNVKRVIRVRDGRLQQDDRQAPLPIERDRANGGKKASSTIALS